MIWAGLFLSKSHRIEKLDTEIRHVNRPLVAKGNIDIYGVVAKVAGVKVNLRQTWN